MGDPRGLALLLDPAGVGLPTHAEGAFHVACRGGLDRFFDFTDFEVAHPAAGDATVRSFILLGDRRSFTRSGFSGSLALGVAPENAFGALEVVVGAFAGGHDGVDIGGDLGEAGRGMGDVDEGVDHGLDLRDHAGHVLQVGREIVEHFIGVARVLLKCSHTKQY